jgi:hypothetical protein
MESHILKESPEDTRELSPSVRVMSSKILQMSETHTKSPKEYGAAEALLVLRPPMSMPHRLRHSTAGSISRLPED